MNVTDFTEFFTTFLRFGLEAFKKYPGLYPGLVTRNDDPEARGRIQAKVPEVGHYTAPPVWILPSMPLAGPDYGEFFPPEVGSGVWVSFERGDPSMPRVYFGGWYGKPKGKNDVPVEFQTSAEGTSPYKRGWRTKAGHQVIFNDKDGEESVRIVWHKPDSSDPTNRDAGKFGVLSFDKNGDILVTNQNGSLIHLDAENAQVKVIDENGNFITLDGEGIQLVSKKGDSVTLKGSIQMLTQGDIVMTGASLNMKVGGVYLGDGASSFLAKGTELLSYLNTLVGTLIGHTHTSSAPTFPTGTMIPPAPLPSPSLISTANRTK